MKRLILMSCAILTFCGGCSKAPKEDSAFFMGTLVHVTAYDPRAFLIVFDEFRRLEGVFNPFNEESELARLNRKGELVASEDLFSVLKLSREFYAATAGAFDVSVAPLSFLWKDAIRARALPAPAAIETVQTHVGMEYVYLDEATHRVKLLKDGVKLDLGALAKGYAIDSAIALLREAEITSVLVNAGGSVYGLGDNNGRPWKVAIQDPRQKGHTVEKIFLSDQAVATSGDYEQFFEIGGKRYSHIIDPKTGYPVIQGPAAATVVADSAMTADALATSCLLVDLSRCRELLGRFPGVSVKLVDAQGKVNTL